MKIDQVPKFWRNGAPAKSFTNNYWTDGKSLYSYNLQIGYTCQDGKKILIEYNARANNFISATTSRHVNLAAFYADSSFSPQRVLNDELLDNYFVLHQQ